MRKPIASEQYDWDHRYERADKDKPIPADKDIGIDHKWRIWKKLKNPDGGFNGGIELVNRKKDGEMAIRKMLVPHHVLGPDQNRWRREMLMMRRFSHHNIPSFTDGWYGKKGGAIYMEPCRYGNVSRFTMTSWHDKFRPDFRELILYYMMRELATAVLYLQTGFKSLQKANEEERPKKQGWVTVVHGDIRPDQVFLSCQMNYDRKSAAGPPRVMLGDFGWAQFIRPENVSEPHDGPLVRMKSKPPEFPGQISPYTDIYGIGAFAWLFLAPRMNEKDMFEGPRQGSFRQYGIGYDLDALISGCLARSPNDRPDIRYLLDMLERGVKRLDPSGHDLERFQPSRFLKESTLWCILYR